MKKTFSWLLLLLCGSASAFEFPFSTHVPPTIASSGTVQLAFSPEDDAGALVVQAIRGARKQVLVQSFSFTHRKIAQALIDARRRGVDVQLIADGEQIRRMERGLVPGIAAAGVATFVDDAHSSAHNKIMVIDAGTPQAVVITGSFNFTQAAQYKNAENLLLFRGNPQLTQAYLANWQRHRAHARPFEQNR
jgi:phosphatidylserine/phosphatidylglycerophosphate/cardiolipin synthase-like enzyme